MRKSAAFGVTLTPFRQVRQRPFPPDFHDRFTTQSLLETLVGGARSHHPLWLAIFFVGLTRANCHDPRFPMCTTFPKPGYYERNYAEQKPERVLSLD